MSADRARLVAPLLSLLFGEVEGAIYLSTAKHEPVEVTTASGVLDFAAESEEAVEVSLTTTADQSAAFSIITTDSEAEAVLKCAADPVLAIVHSATEDVVFVYLGENPGFNEVSDSFPLPGWGGWELTEKSAIQLEDYARAIAEAEKFSAEQSVESEAEKVEAREEEPAQAAESVWHNDMEFVDGVPPAEVMGLPLKLGFGQSRQDKRWPTIPCTFEQLLVKLSTHKESDNKDGPAVLQGSAIQGQRLAKAMETMYLVGLDVDSGFAFDHVIDIARKANLASIIYTTYSNMKPKTLVLQSSFAKWAKKNAVDQEPTDATMRRFLVEDRRWEHSIADTAVVGETVHDVEGVMIEVTHAPMPKFRVIFPLAAPFTFAKQKGLLQAEAINRWKMRLMGLSRGFALPIDESCLDPSRLFYLPAHPKGGQHRIVVTAGNALDFDAVPEYDPRSQDNMADDVFMRAAMGLGAGKGSLMFGEFSLRAWASKRANAFTAVDMIRELSPSRIRGDQNLDKIEIECPFDHEHSNAGDPNDRAAYVINAHAGNSESSFAWGCQHNSCKKRDRLEFVCQALNDGWFTPEDLNDERWQVLTVKPQEFLDPVQVMNELMAEISVTSPEENPGIATDWLRKLHKARPLKSQQDTVLRKMVAQGFGKLRDLQNDSAAVKMMVSAEEDHIEKARRLRAQHTEQMKKLGLSQDDKAVFEEFPILPGVGYVEQRMKLLSTLKYVQEAYYKGPYFYNYGGSRFVVEAQEGKEKANIIPLDWLNMANMLHRHVHFIKITDESRLSIALPDRILREIIVSNEWEVPELMTFTFLPYYTAENQLIYGSGYNRKSKVYLNPIRDDFSRSMPALSKDPEEAKDQCRAAVTYLFDNVFHDFPFDDGPDAAKGGKGSKAHVLAMILQPFVRQLITGPTPVILVTKPSPGTGASLLIKCALMINSGHSSISSLTESAGDEEQRKQITSILRSGQQYAWIDNIRQNMSSAAYCNLATASEWSDRLLGKSEVVSYPNRIQVIFSGNNPRGSYEVMRRCLPIRLDTRSDPRKREHFKIDEPETFVTENHDEHLRAVLTIIQYWVDQGAPSYSGKPLMSFESWSRVIGGILETAGVEGFLSNLHLTQKYADEETMAWENFFTLWVRNVKANPKLSIPTERLTLLQVATMLTEIEEYPAIGVRYDGEPKTLATRLRPKLDTKLDAPVEIRVAEKDEYLKTLCIKRTKDEHTSQQVYWIEELVNE